MEKQDDLKFLEILDNIKDIVVVTDLDGKIMYVNSAVENIGYDPEKLVGNNFRDYIYPDDLDFVNELL